MIVTRFADDFVVGFQYRGDAKQFLHDLRERFAKFNLGEFKRSMQRQQDGSSLLLSASDGSVAASC